MANKNISVWRGNTTPPTIYHLWLKDDFNLYYFKDDDWVPFIDGTALVKEIKENSLSIERLFDAFNTVGYVKHYDLRKGSLDDLATEYSLYNKSAQATYVRGKVVIPTSNDSKALIIILAKNYPSNTRIKVGDSEYKVLDKTVIEGFPKDNNLEIELSEGMWISDLDVVQNLTKVDKVSQLENDKNYLSATVNNENLIFNNE